MLKALLLFLCRPCETQLSGPECGYSRRMNDPHAQDEVTFAGHDDDEPVAPPAPANQWTPSDGGVPPAPPAPTSSTNALRRIIDAVRRAFDR